MKTPSLLCSVLVALFGISGGAQVPQDVPYDHIHLAAPDPDQAYDWYVTNLDGAATTAALKANGVKFTSEPAAKANPLGHRTAYVEAPGGVRIELVEHTECTWGKAHE